MPEELDRPDEDPIERADTLDAGDPLAPGLRAAFGEALPPGSVLRLLQDKTGSQLDVHLHDDGEPSDAPVTIDDETKALRDPTGRYQVLGEIGRGGVGVVYKGRDQDLGRDVAMKVLREEFVDRPEILERFVEEAQIGGQLQHPGIVPVYELGLQHGERPYFAMKLVKGETLAVLLARRADPGDDRRRFLGIFEQVCQTVAYAHARRVVHRDLKPANVMLGSFGEVQVVDWGFAKVLPKGEVADAERSRRASSVASVISTVRSDPQKGSHSVVGSMLGTPAYMPPEQAIGDVEHMDQRSDVFGLGAMLCEILTGQPPYLEQDGDLIQQAARADLQGAYERIEQSGADQVLVTLCKQCLSPARKARPESGKQVAEAIGQYLHSVEERARQAQIHAAEAKVRARSTMLLSAAAVLLLALGGGGYLFLQQQTQTRREHASQRVAAALNEASVRVGEAKTAGVADLGLWTRAADAAAQAWHLAADADVTDEQRSRVAAFVATIRSEKDEAAAKAGRFARDDAMRQRLLDARIPTDDDVHGKGYWIKEMQRRNAAYAAAFVDYLDGRDLTTMTAEAGAAILAGPLAIELAAALDHWVSGRRYLVRGKDADPSETETTTRLQAMARALDPDSWRNQLRTALAQKDRDPDALLRLHADADLDSLPVVSLQMLGQSLWSANALAEARMVHAAACERFPADFGCMFQMARLHEDAKEWPQAAACYRIARALRPDMREVRHRLGIVWDKLGDHPAGEQLFRQLLEQEPANSHWHSHLAGALAKQGKLDEAIASFQQCIAIDPNYAATHYNLGIALAMQDRFDEAIASYQRAIAIDPKGADAHSSLGVALARQGKIDEAISKYLQAIAIDPKHAGAHNNLGLALAERSKFDEAITSYQQAIALDPKHALTHSNLGLALAKRGKFDEAITSYQQAVALDPNDALAHHNLGIALADRGRFDEALESQRRAETIWSQGDDARAEEGLARTTAEISSLEPQVARMQDRLALARGEREAEDAEDYIAAADLVRRRGEHALCARTYARAFAAFPALLETSPHRYNAAGAAALAAKGEGAAQWNDQERVELRDQSRRWITDDVADWKRGLVGGIAVAAQARERLAHLQKNPAFAGVRGEALQALPTAEAAAWRSLWEDIAAALATKEQGK